MLSAHLPSGYLLGHSFAVLKPGGNKSWVLGAALVGAMVPDLDMLYFHFVSFGRTHHHMFVSHWPLAWLAIALPVILLLHILGRTVVRDVGIAFFVGVLLHLLLDSIAAPIFWLMPFAPGRVELVSVPAYYSHWIVSFVLHWTFLIELSIWAAALFLFWYKGLKHSKLSTE